MVHCCVPYCTADDSKKDDGVTFHKFPRDTNLRDKWTIAISRPGTTPGTLWSPKEASRICSAHFKPCDFSISTTKKILLPNTVPSIFPGCPSYKLKSASNRKKPAPKRQRLVQKRSRDKLFDNEQPTSSIAKTRELKISNEIMEEPHFIKCEPEWSAETEEILHSETEDYFPANNLTRIKTEIEPSCDPELNAEEENRDSFIECETQIVKEEIIEEEEEEEEEEEDISGRNHLDQYVLVNYVDGNKMSSNKLFDLLDSVSADQAYDSEEGGDSDAEDSLAYGTRVMDISAGSNNSSGSLLYNKTPRESNGSPIVSDDTMDVDLDDYIIPDDPNDPASPSPQFSIVPENHSSSEEEEAFPVFQWRKTECDPVFKHSTFSQMLGPKVPVDISSPLAVFLLFMTRSLLTHTTEQSNLYAVQCGTQLNLTVDELCAFLGMLIIMGFHRLPSIRQYWSSDKNFHVPRIASIMSMKRFLKILRFLHLNDNTKMPKRDEPTFDKLYKLRPLITALNKALFENFSPSRYLSISESMVGFKGRSSLKQYMPMKPTKRGLKIWVIACAVTGYMLGFSICEGKSGSLEERGGLGERTVLELSKPFEGLGYCLFFYNLFTSVILLKKLFQRGLYACGIMRADSKHFPKDHLCSDKALSMGKSDFATCGDISVSKWRDKGKKAIVVGSTMHNPSDRTTVRRTNKTGDKETVDCPQSVADYNRHMGGTNHFDQLIACYNLSWKSRRWWLPIWYYLLEVAIVNSFLLYTSTAKLQNCNAKPMSHLSFRSTLADELIGQYHGRKASGVKRKITVTRSKMSTGSTKKQFDRLGEHMPVKGSSRRCGHCSTKKAVKRSRILCSSCDVALCLKCFIPFHSHV